MWLSWAAGCAALAQSGWLLRASPFEASPAEEARVSKEGPRQAVAQCGLVEGCSLGLMAAPATTYEVAERREQSQG